MHVGSALSVLCGLCKNLAEGGRRHDFPEAVKPCFSGFSYFALNMLLNIGG